MANNLELQHKELMEAGLITTVRVEDWEIEFSQLPVAAVLKDWEGKQIISFISRQILKARDEGYKKGVEDEITCLENSPEHSVVRENIIFKAKREVIEKIKSLKVIEYSGDEEEFRDKRQAWMGGQISMIIRVRSLQEELE